MGCSAFLYFQYKPLVDYTLQSNVSYRSYALTSQSSSKTGEENFSSLDVPQKSSIPKEAKPYQSDVRSEVQRAKQVPLKGFLGYAQSQINKARRMLGKASGKLSRANPQDSEKRAKVQKARQLVPEAYGLLNRAESILQGLNTMQEKALGWVEPLRSKISM